MMYLLYLLYLHIENLHKNNLNKPQGAMNKKDLFLKIDINRIQPVVDSKYAVQPIW